MGFVDKTLMPNEVVKYKTRLNRSTAFVATFVWGLIGLVAIVKAPPLAFVLWMIPISMWIRVMTSEFVVTNKRVLIKVGFFRRRSLEMLLTKIESIKFDQSFLERILFSGMGKVTLFGTGGTPETFPNIDKPLEFRRQIQIAIDSLQGGKAS